MKRLLAPVAALAAVLVLSSSALASAPAPDQSTAKYEIDFMTDMIDHHAMAIGMAEMCVEEAIHEPLRATCDEIIAAQSAEIAMMQSWLADWYGISHSPEMTPGMMAQMERLGSLDGERFEVVFMKTMIRHHWQAMTEAEGCLDRAWHGDLRSMCTDIVTAQAAEISQMQTWLCEWYDLCGYFGERRFSA